LNTVALSRADFVILAHFAPFFAVFAQILGQKSGIAIFGRVLLNDISRFPTNSRDTQLNQGVFWT
jgi:hypothetical protein